jgi:hypothetical protein
VSVRALHLLLEEHARAALNPHLWCDNAWKGRYYTLLNTVQEALETAPLPNPKAYVAQNGEACDFHLAPECLSTVVCTDHPEDGPICICVACLGELVRTLNAHYMNTKGKP